MTRRPDAAFDDGMSLAALTGCASDDMAGVETQPFDLPEADRYRRGHVIGAGGMGRVTQAFDGRLGREVALKEIRAPNAALEARLAREASITARLDHPGIVVVHDAGRTAEGALFYTMRVVRGRTLDAALVDAGADREARMRLLRFVHHACEAIAFAHSHGVIHRDLKPANIMVGEFGETQVLDWGLAVVSDEGHDTAEAGGAEIVGTPRYMSPEQAAGRPADPRTDVWSLGAILFELYAGRPARIHDSAAGDPLVALAARSTEVPDLREIVPDVPRAFAAIVSRATQRDPAARYPDARALAADIDAYLDGRRVAAHSYTAWELLRRFVIAWRAPLIVAAIALIATIVGVSLAFQDADNERDKAIEAEQRAVVSARAAESAADATLRALTEADRALARLLASRAVAFLNIDARPEAEVLAAHALALAPTPDARGVLMASRRSPRPKRVGGYPLPAMCRHPNVTSDARVLTCVDDGWTSVWDASRMTGEAPRLRWRVPTRGAWGAAVYEPLGLVAVTGPAVEAEVFSLADGEPRPDEPIFETAYYAPRANIAGNAVQFAGSARVSIANARGNFRLEPCDTREEMAGAVDESGERWAVSCRDGALYVGTLGGDFERHETPLAAPRGPASAIAFDSAGETLLLGSTDGHVVVYDLTRRAVIQDLPSGAAMTLQIAISPDGLSAVVLGDDGGPRILDIPSRTWRGRLPDVGTRVIRFLAGAPADLVTIGASVDIWRLERTAPWRIDVGGGVTSVAASPDGTTVAITRGHGVELRAVGDGRQLAQHDRLGSVAKGGAFTVDGASYVMSPGGTEVVARWRGEDLDPFAAPLVSSGALRAAGVLGRRGERPLWVGLVYRRGIHVWPDGDSEPLASLLGADEEHLLALAVAPNGERLIGHTLDETLVALDAAAPLTHTLTEWSGAISVGIDIDAEHVLIGERGGAALVHAPTGTLVRDFAMPQTSIIAVALSPDGRFAAGGDAEGQVYLWQRSTGTLIARFQSHNRRISALAFAPDGTWLATGSWDETVRFYDLTDGDLPPHEAEAAWGLGLDTLLD